MVDLQAISGLLERGEIDSARYLDQLMRFVTARIGCSRATLRLLSETERGPSLRTLSLYDATTDRMLTAPDIDGVDASAFLARIQRDGSVAITDTATSRLVAGAWLRHLEGAGVRAVMEMACSINGTLFGTLGCEQLATPVDWSPKQQQLLRKVASRTSLTLAHLVQAGVDTTPGALWQPSLPSRLATLPTPLDRTRR